MRGIEGKRFIIGGGATGIGAATARRLVEEGAKVVVGDINAAGLEALAPDLGGRKGEAVTFVFDLADPASTERLVQACVDRFGGIDGVAIPGADVSKENLGADLDIFNMQTSVWERTFKVNVLGHVHLMRLAIPHMIAAGGGAIVSVSSAAAYFGHKANPAYGASKAALHSVVRHVARLCGKDRIRCNAVAPGLVVTDKVKANMPERVAVALNEYASHRLGDPDDLASAIMFLLSDEGAWITGRVNSVNGGYIFRD
jgi:NAD(P)-dependent dehydrogenase (short-subunit alcohol dehydrogenase family)